MSALCFLAAAFCALWVFKLLFSEKPGESKSTTFTAAVKYGEFQAVVHYESHPENPIEPSAERIIRLWAIGREDRSYSREMHLALEGELRHHFPSCRPEVVSMTVTSQPEPDVPPVEPTRAERVKATLTSDADTIQEIGDTINELREKRKDLWDNRKYPGSDKPIGHHLHEKADHLIRTVLHGSKGSR